MIIPPVKDLSPNLLEFITQQQEQIVQLQEQIVQQKIRIEALEAESLD